MNDFWLYNPRAFDRISVFPSPEDSDGERLNCLTRLSIIISIGIFPLMGIVRTVVFFILMQIIIFTLLGYMLYYSVCVCHNRKCRKSRVPTMSKDACSQWDDVMKDETDLTCLD